MSFKVTILGSSAALPTVTKHHSAHALNVHEQFYLIDCGEGTQSRLMQAGISPLKINAIFLTHLHGDHFYGLFPLVSTMGLLHRRTPLKIYAPHPFGELLQLHRRYFEAEQPFEIQFTPVDTTAHQVVFENKVMEVYSVPLRHKIPTAGYHFREKTPPLNVRKEMIEFYSLNILQIVAAKRGEDVTLDNGRIVPNSKLTYLPHPARSYAYLSDTMFSAKAAVLVSGVDLLFHEATFARDDKALAAQTGHSTAAQAAKAATLAGAGKLIIGHFSNRYKDETILLDQAREVFADTETAREGETFTVNPRPL